MKWRAACLLAVAAICFAASAQAAGMAHTGRLDQVKARGYLNCGVFAGVVGFATVKDGHYSGFETDICRAIAAAIFGTADKVKFTEVASVDVFRRMPALDLVARRLTWDADPRIAAWADVRADHLS